MSRIYVGVVAMLTLTLGLHVAGCTRVVSVRVRQVKLLNGGGQKRSAAIACCSPAICQLPDHPVKVDLTAA